MRYLVVAVIVLSLLVLCAPLSLGYDSQERMVRVKWLGLTGAGRLRAKKPKRLEKPLREQEKGLGWAGWRRLSREGDLARELLGGIGRLGRDLLRIVSFKGSAASISLPEPGWNGMLYGLLAALDLEGVVLAVNFNGVNFARIWLTFYPYQVIARLIGWLARLPWRRLLRVSRDLRKIRRAKRSS